MHHIGQGGASAEALLFPAPMTAAEGDGGEAAAEADEEGGEAAEADAAAEGSSSGSSGPPDYANKLLRYVAASPGQEFMKALELRRPKKAEDDGGDAEQKPEPVPVTFRVLDERLPLLEVRPAACIWHNWQQCHC